MNLNRHSVSDSDVHTYACSRRLVIRSLEVGALQVRTQPASEEMRSESERMLKPLRIV
jgi:hypothetical protein